MKICSVFAYSTGEVSGMNDQAQHADNDLCSICNCALIIGMKALR